MVFRLNLAGLPDSEIKRLINERCAECGPVKRVDLYREIDRAGKLFALVEMVGEAALACLMREFNAHRFGDTVIVRLAPLTEDAL